MRLAIIGGIGVVVLRMALFQAGRSPQGMEFMLVHVLAIVTIVFFTGQGILYKDRT
ncbi:MAG: hypothetical protein IT225_09425, partial [Flavobacteriales bacterium]|nr:hypothetical protein [Flavobacteriales bacterium]